MLGTLMTIRFWPTRALIRGYVEVWRGLPIIVTFFIIFFVFADPRHSSSSSTRTRPARSG